MESQAKIELSHSVVSGVVIIHGCKDLTNQAEVLLDQPLLDVLRLLGYKSGTEALGKKFEGGNGFLNVFEV